MISPVGAHTLRFAHLAAEKYGKKIALRARPCQIQAHPMLTSTVSPAVAVAAAAAAAAAAAPSWAAGTAGTAAAAAAGERTGCFPTYGNAEQCRGGKGARGGGDSDCRKNAREQHSEFQFLSPATATTKLTEQNNGKMVQRGRKNNVSVREACINPTWGAKPCWNGCCCICCTPPP